MRLNRGFHRNVGLRLVRFDPDSTVIRFTIRWQMGEAYLRGGENCLDQRILVQHLAMNFR
jgi:hypothetical protein